MLQRNVINPDVMKEAVQRRQEKLRNDINTRSWGQSTLWGFLFFLVLAVILVLFFVFMR